MSILVVAEHECGVLSSSVHHAVTAAVELAFITASEVHVLAVGSRCEDVAEAAAEISGVMKVICVATTDEEEALPSAVDIISSKYRHVVFAATPASTVVAEQVASMLNVNCVLNVMKVVSEDVFEQDADAGPVVIRCSDRVVVITAKITSFANADRFGHAWIQIVNVKHDVPPEWSGLGLCLGKSAV